MAGFYFLFVLLGATACGHKVRLRKRTDREPRTGGILGAPITRRGERPEAGAAGESPPGAPRTRRRCRRRRGGRGRGCQRVGGKFRARSLSPPPQRRGGALRRRGKKAGGERRSRVGPLSTDDGAAAGHTERVGGAPTAKETRNTIRVLRSSQAS